MTNTQIFAQRELDILSKSSTNPENRPIIEPFRDEILALCEKFGMSGQSGGSAPFTATAIAHSIKKLLLQNPICPVTGIDEEWVNITEMNGGNPIWQNSRCSALFKYPDGKCSYCDAIVWKGEEYWDTFTGRVYIDDKDFELIASSQYVKFPFKPKTFYLDVIRIPITKAEAERKNMHFIEDNNKCYYTILKNPKQLEKVFKYYDKK